MSATFLVVDDHPVFRAGIAALFESAGYRGLPHAASAAEAVALARAHQPDLIIMDLGLPDESGINATAQIIGERPETRVLVVTMYDDDGTVQQALRAGAAGYIVKDAAHSEILAAAAATLQGSLVLGASLARYDQPLVGVPERDNPFGLTPRETEVLDLVARGLTNNQIAARLGLSGKTIANLVSILLVKCAASDRVDLAVITRRSAT
ncbi:DNA-binding NarL/FixJ family response regulator [Microbacterium terrae]|uniref:Oxygen regulatory protein NreC n=1 Tax=Microbacterium terrae TaxID=69369 RepID=A0A0M2H4R8_9MICO|nr:response regulator transcription factor [Microbacterium terrae]KJL38732.1 Oxygen regulatory protein NreC [Microbacterium terrae]MBP1076151.1 DNA-binding NarL/FixJ family response regulator [Microbacterium terrae]GLJ96971.1 DNA-binding response regulator [Microbacterium terrae]